MSSEQTKTAITRLRSPLAQELDIEAMEPEEAAQLHQLLAFFEPAQKLVLSLLKLLFCVAGFLWFPIFFSGSVGISGEVLESFRKNQYRIYLLLMTAWGYLKHRRMKQGIVLLHLSRQLEKPWHALTREEIKAAGKLSTFEGLWRFGDGDKAYFHLALYWICIVGTLFQFGRQALLLWG